jgi:hypothetical protein
MESKRHQRATPDRPGQPNEEIAPAEAESPESLLPTGGPENAGIPPFEVRIVRDWDVDVFHERVLQLESQGYVSRRETYRITPETNPETGEVLHLHSIELVKPKSG